MSQDWGYARRELGPRVSAPATQCLATDGSTNRKTPGHVTRTRWLSPDSKPEYDDTCGLIFAGSYFTVNRTIQRILQRITLIRGRDNRVLFNDCIRQKK